MAFPIAAAIPAIASLVGTGANAMAQGKMNKKTREWNEMMYHTQRRDNTLDWALQNQYNELQWNKQNQWNLDMWNRENEYNSPMMMMQRFKEAGLNPNLIYGQSNMGGSVSTANLDTDKKQPAGVNAWTPKAPQFDFNEGIMSYAAFRESSARTNNLEAQNDVLKQDAALRAAQTANTVSQTAKTDFELNLASDLRKTSIDAAQASLRKTQVETDISLNRDEREAAMNSSNLREAAARIMLMRKESINKDLDSKLKQLDIQLKELGIQPSDNAAMRVLGRLLPSGTLDRVGDKINEGYKNFKNYWNK